MNIQPNISFLHNSYAMKLNNPSVNNGNGNKKKFTSQLRNVSQSKIPSHIKDYPLRQRLELERRDNLLSNLANKTMSVDEIKKAIVISLPSNSPYRF